MTNSLLLSCFYGFHPFTEPTTSAAFCDVLRMHAQQAPAATHLDQSFHALPGMQFLQRIWEYRLADEVERLQPFADKAAELESRLATYEQQLAEAHAAQDNSSSETVILCPLLPSPASAQTCIKRFPLSPLDLRMCAPWSETMFRLFQSEESNPDSGNAYMPCMLQFGDKTCSRCKRSLRHQICCK